MGWLIVLLVLCKTAGGTEFVLERYTTAGVRVFTKLYGGGSADSAFALVVDSTNAVTYLGTCCRVARVTVCIVQVVSDAVFV